MEVYVKGEIKEEKTNWGMMEYDGLFDLSLTAEDGQVLTAIRGISKEKLEQLHLLLSMAFVRSVPMNL